MTGNLVTMFQLIKNTTIGGNYHLFLQLIHNQLFDV